jgi:hypothetical protein
MTHAGLCAALRTPLVFAQRAFARLNRRALNAKAPARITSCGGRITVSYPADGRTPPVILGLCGGQMFDPEARIHIRLPALSYAQWSELKPYLQSLATLASLQMAGRHVAGVGLPVKTSEQVSTNDTTLSCRDSPVTEAFLVAAPE